MVPIVCRRKITWTIEYITRERFAFTPVEDSDDEDEEELDDDDRYGEYSGYKSFPFRCFIDKTDVRWEFSITGRRDGTCTFSMEKVRDFNDDWDIFDQFLPHVPGFEINMTISIEQENGNLKEIKSHCEDSCYGIYIDKFLSIDEIFDLRNDYIDDDGSLIIIIDMTISNSGAKCDDDDKTLKSLCISKLSTQISSENVFELLFYADRCNVKLLENKCLEFIVLNYDDIKKNEEKWKSISSRLMFKIMDALKCYTEYFATLSGYPHFERF